MSKKIILVTGGTGYIGSHGVVAFEQAGYKTVIVDNFSNSQVSALEGIEKILSYRPDFFELDLRNKE
jgi:UDP-glucose 4-epimerase